MENKIKVIIEIELYCEDKEISELTTDAFELLDEIEIPVGRRKRWWEFWKNDGKKAIEELMKQYKQELILGDDGDIFIPTNDSK